MSVFETLLFRRERVVTAEHRMRARARTAWVQWENIAVFDESGRVVEIQSVGQDIPARQSRNQSFDFRLKYLASSLNRISHKTIKKGCHEKLYGNVC